MTALALARGWVRINHPDPARFPIWGVDVSHHQGAVDWPALASDEHVGFVYLKATEGGDWTDPSFAEHWPRARAAGLKVGAYHFFTFCRPAGDQAHHFLEVVPRDAGALPPALDVEFGGNCRTTSTRENIRGEVALWLRVVEQGIGRRPVIYATADAYEAFLDGSGLGNPIWLRDVWAEPHEPRLWTFWQFANRGHVKGVKGFVDLNVFAGDRSALDAL